EDDPTTGQPELVPVEAMPRDELVAAANSYLEARGLDLEALVAGDYSVEVTVQADDPSSPLYGYIVFDQGGDKYVGRNILDDVRPKYKNSLGQKLQMVLGQDNGRAPVWLVEGVFDALSIRHLGVSPVVPILGSAINEAWAFPFRGRTVFIALDADYKGWKSATEIREVLTAVGANPIVLEMPADLGGDPSEALVNDPDGLDDWVSSVLAKYTPDDSAYVRALISGDTEALPVLPTGLADWDAMLGGGFKPGVHVVGAEPKAGKSSLVLYLLKRWIDEQQKTGLYLTYEIPKRQSWMRVASTKDPAPWATLERYPDQMKPKTATWLKKLAKSMRVEAGWTLAQIKHAIDDFDVVIVDYLQRMPSTHKRDQIRHAIGENIAGLSDLARDKGKVIIVVSSLPRAEYGRITQSSFKESGDIEYVVQSATGLINYKAQSMLMGNVVLNTRGSTGTFWLNADLAHARFEQGEDPRGKTVVALGGTQDG
ncbi:MAG: bifunctional DNA primase/helicase, partial [Planctomycetota bacterium]